MKGITWINLLLGVWLIVAAVAHGMAGATMTNDFVLGVLLIAFSWWMLAAVAPPVGVAWFEMLCGLWLIVAPFALAYSAMRSSTVNDVVVGVVTIIVAAIAASAISHAETPTLT